MTLWGENYGRVNSVDSASGMGLLNNSDIVKGLRQMNVFQEAKAYINGVFQ